MCPRRKLTEPNPEEVSLPPRRSRRGTSDPPLPEVEQPPHEKKLAKWTQTELEILTQNMHTESDWEKIHELLPGRSQHSILKRWEKLNTPVPEKIETPKPKRIVRQKPAVVPIGGPRGRKIVWTDEELALLESVADSITGWKQVVDQIPHGQTSIRMKFLEIRGKLYSQNRRVLTRLEVAETAPPPPAPPPRPKPPTRRKRGKPPTPKPDQTDWTPDEMQALNALLDQHIPQLATSARTSTDVCVKLLELCIRNELK